MMKLTAPKRKIRIARCVVLAGFMLIATISNGLANEQAEKAATFNQSASGELVVPNSPNRPIPSGSTPNLESLLRLPSGFVTTGPAAVAGASEAEWRRRFAKSIREAAEAETSLEATKRDLEGVAVGGSASQWSVAAPGGGNSSPNNSPLSFKLRQKLRVDRERIEETEKALRALRIEADLAGVPQTWRSSTSESIGSGRN